MQAAVALPKITAQPRPATAVIGSSASFEVRTSGATPQVYQWRQNGANIANDSHILGATSSLLKIQALTPADAGKYTVVITNAYGSITSSPAVLTVRPDTTKPIITMTSPKVSLTVTNPNLSLQGTVKDNVGVASVSYRVNTTPWVSVPANTNWAGQVTLTPGVNTIQAFATDVNSNKSATVTAKVTYTPMAQLSVTVPDSSGSVSGTIVTKSNKSIAFAVGKQVTLTATPAKGQTFSGWSGWTNSTSATIKFTMPSDSVDLTAQFTAAVLPGGISYEGLIVGTSLAAMTNMGLVSATLSGQSYSAKFTFMNQVVTKSGKVASTPFEPNLLTAHTTVTIGGKNLDILLTFYKSDPFFMEGTLSDGAAPFATIQGFRVQNKNLGTYNAAFVPSGSTEPQGYGFGTLDFSSKNVTLNITLPDENATLTAASANYLETGMVAVFSPLYNKKGFIAGFLDVTNNVLTGSLFWYKTPGAGTNYFPNGFFQTLDVKGGKFTPLASLPAWGVTDLSIDGTPVINGTVDFTHSLNSIAGYSITINDGTNPGSWDIAKSTGLVTFRRNDGTVSGNGIFIPTTSSEPGVYGFSAGIESNVGVVHSVFTGPK